MSGRNSLTLKLLWNSAAVDALVRKLLVRGPRKLFLPLLRLGYTVSADPKTVNKDLILSVGFEKTPTEANYFLIQSERYTL